MTCQYEKSEALFEEAKSVFVGGVNSPVRAFRAVGGTPIFFKRGKGAYLFSEDGRQYIDYVLSWGPLLLGHAYPAVVQAIGEAASEGISFGAPHQRELELAKLIREFFPSCEKIRFVNSGTEATMSAIRLARGATGRKKILKFNGCYHGHSDGLLVKAGSGGLTFGVPDSCGVLPEIASSTLSIEYNDIQQLEQVFELHKEDLAAVILEPVVGNMGVVAADPVFLQRLRELCSDFKVILIFDEVMTGFRVHLGGAQALYGITPDLTCLAKVIGGGLPCGAYGGRSELMDLAAPSGPVYQAGTMSGNPVVMAAGIAMLTTLKESPILFQNAVSNTQELTKGIQAIAKQKGFPLQVNAVGTMFTVFFAREEVKNLKGAMASDIGRFKQVYHKLLQKGIYTAPSQFEANFVSAAHTHEDVEKTLEAYLDAFFTEV